MKKPAILLSLGILGATFAAPMLAPAPTIAAKQALPGPQVTQGAAACASISKNDERLACYDHLFGDPKARPDNLGQWRVSTNEGPRKDVGRVIIGLPVKASDDPRHLEGSRLNFFAACRHGATALWFNFGRELKNVGDEVEVNLTLDGKAVPRNKMVLSINRRSIGLFDNDEARALLEQWQTGRELELHIMPNRETASRARFAIHRLDTALKPLARACQWDDA
ncbi:MAG: hypothetical protein AAFO61_03870 [Pseudomonadota bacterium]